MLFELGVRVLLRTGSDRAMLRGFVQSMVKSVCKLIQKFCIRARTSPICRFSVSASADSELRLL